ncbi:hypothetical protein AK812_SmicGene41556 [Symbiodinium microadriaticum]|uniref:Uncharacterized protein n=1 Tax=Symbiodinium microadriaticum TaxID=2951 RepID=A0A1Q9C5W0_SYMMI|nr:hypothetical protein AK812_SmicGene41556 [Symbiodinium microadriaticum]CAE7240348.1 unnamed protein product [Symbiodinium sp. KB8]CAE7820761.1 unnamed protein product [Symbiodinium microadriaticum]
MDKSLDQPEETRELCKEAGIVVQDVADGTTPTATSATDAGNAMHNNKASLMKLLYSILSQKKPKPVPAHPRFLFMLWLGCVRLRRYEYDCWRSRAFTLFVQCFS